jgi:two-component system, OmpR family, sensor kinase
VSRLTLKDRVTLASALVLACGLALLTLGINLLLSHRLAADASTVLRERADAQLAAVDVKSGRIVRRDAIRNETLDRETWLYAGGRAIVRAPGGQDLQRAADALSGAASDTERNVGEKFRLRAEPAFVGRPRGSRVGTIVVAVPLAPYEHTERIARYSTLLLDLFVLAAGVLLVRRGVGKALQPVADMTTRAADWSEHDLDRRFGLGPPRDELTALSATLDGLLARIGSSLRHEQRFSAEMAHELRTPLSGMRGEAELALNVGGPADVRASLEQILRGTERMEAVIETLLAAARADARGAPGSADAAGAARLVVDALAPVAQSAGVEVGVTAPEPAPTVGADEDLVAQALHPLLDNAVRHARRAVTVAISRERAEVVFCVQDDGRGIEDTSPESLFEPGASGAGGAGLGLALARRLARSCGGEVSAMASGDGGRFLLRLPALR